MIVSIVFTGWVTPLFAHAEIKVTEIAWMGTANSQYEEWVELYNSGTDDVDLSGWKLFKSGSTTLFSLTGTITHGQYYLVCRTTASLQNPLGGICNEQGAWGGSGLNNTSDQVILKDSQGTVAQSIDGTGGWPAGDAAAKQTMQWDGSGWVTGTATSGVATVGNNGGATTTTDDGSTITNTVVSDTHKRDPKEKIDLIKPDPIYVAHMNIPDYGIAGVAVPMKAEVTKDKIISSLRGRYEWSMGDGASFKFFDNQPISHVFAYPGDYTVVLAYYSDIFRDEPDSIHRKIITIAPSSVSISGTTDDGGVILQNDSSKDVDLGGWSINSNGSAFTFPNYTMIVRGKQLFISGKTIGFTVVPTNILLKNPNGQMIASYPVKKYHPLTPSYIGGGAEQDSVTEVVVSESDWSAQSQDAPPQTEKTPGKSFDDYKWYVLFGLLVIGVMVAYFVRRLYANSSETEDSSEDDSDEFDYDML